MICLILDKPDELNFCRNGLLEAMEEILYNIAPSLEREPERELEQDLLCIVKWDCHSIIFCFHFNIFKIEVYNTDHYLNRQDEPWLS